MLRKDFVRKKIELIHQDLGRLEQYVELTFAELVNDWVAHNVVEMLLLKVIGRGIDINQHIISERVSTQIAAPLDYKQTFLKLAELKVLPQSFATETAESANFRNILVHEYNNIDEQTFYKSVGDAIKQYARYCDYILKFLE